MDRTPDGRGCPYEAVYRGRCVAHARLRERVTHGNKQVYNSKRWQVLRRSVLYNHPLCECGQIATDVDHIVPLPEGAPYSPANCQSLCAVCHGRKTKREQLRPS